jgi:lipopolysaccharide assembly protein A
MRLISSFFLLVIIFIGVTFAILNSAPVPINYYFANKQISLSLLLTLSLGLGILLGFLFNFIYWLRMKTENMHLKSRLKITEKEIENLRSLPLKDQIVS